MAVAAVRRDLTEEGVRVALEDVRDAYGRHYCFNLNLSPPAVARVLRQVAERLPE